MRGLLLIALLVVAVAVASAAQDFYDTRPAHERPLPAQRIPAGLHSLSSRECGTCHVAIYREWQQSVHAQAWRDPQFQAELKKEPPLSWLCVNCHTPLRDQLDSLVVDLAAGDVAKARRVANPDFVPALRVEGVGCASCHVRDGAVEGPYRDVKARHAVRFSAALRGAEVCLRCHQAVQAYPGKNFVCTFQTGDEWRSSSYAARGVACQHCHMPQVTRPLVAGGPARAGRLHGWIGSHLRKGLETDPALWDSLAGRLRPGVELDPDPVPHAAPGTEATWNVRVVNAHAGHDLPTEDPERALRIGLAALSSAGDTLARSEHVIAQRYRWYPTVEKLSDNRLAPGAHVAVTLRFRVPPGAYRLEAWALNERISDANADYHHLPPWYPRRAEVARVELGAPGR